GNISHYSTVMLATPACEVTGSLGFEDKSFMNCASMNLDLTRKMEHYHENPTPQNVCNSAGLSAIDHARRFVCLRGRREGISWLDGHQVFRTVTDLQLVDDQHPVLDFVDVPRSAGRQ